jgi:hypothetical protein
MPLVVTVDRVPRDENEDPAAGVQGWGTTVLHTVAAAVAGRQARRQARTIGPGVWEHIDHASTDDPEMRAIGHPGYEWVAADRSANVAVWTSPKVREVIERRGIRLISYRQASLIPDSLSS